MLVGGVRARYADSVSGTAALTTLRLSGATSNVVGSFSGSVSKFTGGQWVTQLSGFGAAVTPVASGVSVGVMASGDGNRVQGGTWNGEASGGLLSVLSQGRSMVTLGLSMGAVRTIYDSTIDTRMLSARFQQRLNRRTSISAGFVSTRTDSVRHTDATVELSYSDTRLRASAAAGVRAGDLEDDPWGQGHVEFHAFPRLTLELTLGRYPQNLVGFTDGLYVAVGTRISIAGDHHRSRVPERPVEIEPVGEERIRLTIRYSGDAQSVEIVGDWNGWLPLSLEREFGNRWSVDLNLEPGIYTYSIVVNGSEWTVPDGVPGEPDDFGGVVATLVVGR